DYYCQSTDGNYNRLF
nr:immunoglobulin light chain junction region [Macaca mulatta]MOV66323.1 immunoglobulin light chain junction region [Macaca mulatta]MOV66701.1 immunoglobulin light chain junction region [Macaca mulatta]MOV66763.1 immunoglobulin light chain junction region [Macaca mulatta]MOV67499.1 immunoglobulin light chain junction region [Macaca mulatta]